MNWLPFLAYYERTTFIALSNFIASILVYFPLGYLIHRLRSDKKHGMILISLVALWIALPLELAQGMIEGRFPDVTDVLGALIGGLAGTWISAQEITRSSGVGCRLWPNAAP